MNLTYITNARIPTEKAHGIQIMKMCEAFANHGLEVELVIPRRFNKIKEDPFTYYDVERNFEITKLTTIDLMPIAGPFKWLAYWVNYIMFSLSSFFYCLFKDSDVFYGRHELPLLYLSFWNDNVFWEVHQPRNTFITRQLLKRVDGLIAITQGLKDFFESRGYPTEDILVAHDAVDLSDFEIKDSKEVLREKLDLPQDKVIVAHIGKYKTMEIKKGIDEIIDSFSEAGERTSNIFLLLVGLVGSEIKEVEKRAQKAGLKEGEYKFVSHVKRSKALRYMKAADVLLMNYPKTDHYSYYMSPLKLFEYMTTGNLIITSDLPSIREVLDECSALFFPPGDNEALVENIFDIIKNLDEMRELGSESREKVENYTWQGRVGQIIQFTQR